MISSFIASISFVLTGAVISVVHTTPGAIASTASRSI
jgi:hypothetical protein